MGPVETWPDRLRTLIDVAMMSDQAMMIMWGPEFYTIYNRGHSYIHGTKHPQNFGMPYKDSWPEMWDSVYPYFHKCLFGGESAFVCDQFLETMQNDSIQEGFYTWSQSPIFLDDGSIGGIFVTCLNTTVNVIGKRRIRTLYDLGQKSQAFTVLDTIKCANEELAHHQHDVPFSIIYMRESENTYRLRALQGLPNGHIAAPEQIDVSETRAESWPFSEVLASNSFVIANVKAIFGEIKGDIWPEPITYAIVHPLYTVNTKNACGVVVVAASPRNVCDSEYQKFLEMVALQISSSVANAYSREQDKLRVEELAENDRLRTAFFHNVSHELRTPLTLMLGPLESIMTAEEFSPSTQASMNIILNNTHRLRRLVNNLLDFAKIESKVSRGNFAPVDISLMTRNFASYFQDAVEQAGMQFIVKASAVTDPVYVDSEMWELVVSNLLSNALKYTQKGKIEVEIKEVGNFVELRVSDTGVGIAPEHVSKVFSRFTTVRTEFNRTNEGTGIGLSLTRELVRLHGGSIEVSSEVGVGSVFLVRIPIGKDHLPSNLISDRPIGAPIDSIANPANFSRHLRKSSFEGNNLNPEAPRILLVDDNADMRKYIGGLLMRQGWNVTLACDGEEAFKLASENSFDLVLSDVMMPKLSGFQLLAALRENKKTRNMPIILLSARGGEDAQLEGLKMGADDYLLKPCSEGQIVIRVKLHLELGRLRANLQNEVDARVKELDEANKNLKVSEEQFRSLAAISPVGILRLQHSKVAYTNDKWQMITGVGAAAMTKSLKEWEDAIHPDDRDRVITHWRDFVMSSALNMTEEVRYVSPSGSLTYALIDVNRVGGEKNDYLIVATDITEVKRLERERLEAIKKAEEEQRKRAQDAEYHRQLQEQFVNTICHEIRNPLNGIYNNADLLLSSVISCTDIIANGPFNEDTRKFLLDQLKSDHEAVDAILSCAAHQKMITNDVLDISKIDAGNMTLNEVPFDAVMTVRSAARMFATEMTAKGIELQMDLPASVTICGDHNRLSQVLINLLSNSIKFTAKAPVKKIKISLSSTPIENDKADILISVADTGLGMTKEEQTQIFQRFKQGNNNICENFGGHGLGLYICRSLIELMGGSITARSVRHKGTTITLNIKCAKAKEGSVVRPTTSPTMRSLVTQHKRNILVVEDNTINQKVLLNHLTKIGHACKIANNGKEALDRLYAPNSTDKFDVILMDIQMPIMDGLECTQKIREREMELKTETRMPIIGLSGNATKAHIETAYKAGMVDFVTKPYQLHDLLQKIEKHVHM